MTRASLFVGLMLLSAPALARERVTCSYWLSYGPMNGAMGGAGAVLFDGDAASGVIATEDQRRLTLQLTRNAEGYEAEVKWARISDGAVLASAKAKGRNLDRGFKRELGVSERAAQMVSGGAPRAPSKVSVDCFRTWQ